MKKEKKMYIFLKRNPRLCLNKGIRDNVVSINWNQIYTRGFKYCMLQHCTMLGNDFHTSSKRKYEKNCLPIFWHKISNTKLLQSFEKLWRTFKQTFGTILKITDCSQNFQMISSMYCKEVIKLPIDFFFNQILLWLARNL